MPLNSADAKSQAWIDVALLWAGLSLWNAFYKGCNFCHCGSPFWVQDIAQHSSCGQGDSETLTVQTQGPGI